MQINEDTATGVKKDALFRLEVLLGEDQEKLDDWWWEGIEKERLKQTTFEVSLKPKDAWKIIEIIDEKKREILENRKNGNDLHDGSSIKEYMHLTLIRKLLHDSIKLNGNTK